MTIYLVKGRGETTPRHLRIYANHSTIVDFAEAEDATPHLNISLSEGEVGVVEYPLRASAFASVHSVSLFFVSVASNLSGLLRLIHSHRARQSAENLFRFSTSGSEGIASHNVRMVRRN